MKKLNRLLIWIWIPIVSVLIGITGEIIYNLPIKKQNEYQYVDIDSIEMDGFHLIEGSSFLSDGNVATLTIKFKKQYVDKFTYTFRYNNKDAFACDIIVNKYQDSEKANPLVINDKNNVVLSESTVNVRATTDQIQIKTYDGSDPVTISKIAINNTGNFSEYRMLFVTITSFFIITIFVCWKRKYVISLETAFLTITILVGGLSVAALPNHKVGCDEEIHFGRSYYWGETVMGKETITAPYGIEELYNVRLSNWPYDLAKSEQEKKQEDAYWNNVSDYLQKNSLKENWKEDTNYSFQMSTVAYIFQFLFIRLGMLLRLPFVYVYMMGRFSNVILYAILGYLAIRHMTAGKRILFIFALMPTAMMSTMTYTYDTWVNGFSFLGMAYMLEMWMESEKKIEWKEFAISIGAFVLASMPKAIYIPFILIMLLIPKNRFRNKREMYVMKGLVIAAFLIMLSSFIWPAVGSSNVEGDNRGGDTSVSGQLSYILCHPWFYTKLLLGSIWKTLYPYTIGTEGLAQMGHFENFANVYLIDIALVYAVATDCKKDENTGMKLWHKLCVAIVSIGVMCLIWTALYLSFTPVGLNQINGVQGRYYLPVTIWILLLLRNKKIINNMEPAKDNLVLAGFSLAILLPIVYANIISLTF